MELNIRWLSEENLQKLFIEFPMPLALLKLEGGVEFINKRFQFDYSLNVLKDSAIRKLTREPGTIPLQITLPHRDGISASVLIHAIQLTNFTLLVFDNTPGGVPDSEMHAMRQRLVELEELSVTDSLTGAWNRLPLKRTAEVEIKRTLRYHHPISFVFFDIDRFKQINDNYGHSVGDDILKTLVEIIRARIRDSDTLYRWGGEEFVILATSTTHGEAAILAESVRLLVEKHDFPVVGNVTISLGVAEFLPGDDLDMWLHRADKAAYAAKAKGRNRVISDPFGGSDIWNREQESMPVQLIWHDHYECGNTSIDEQHFQLFEEANRIIKLILGDTDKEELLTELTQLIKSVDKHFKVEEALLEKINYPELEEHKRSHAVLLERAQQFRREVLQGETDVGHLLEYLTYDVVAKHILITDRKYYALIAENNFAEAV